MMMISSLKGGIPVVGCEAVLRIFPGSVIPVLVPARHKIVDSPLFNLPTLRIFRPAYCIPQVPDFYYEYCGNSQRLH